MNLTELITTLQAIEEKHGGDLPVRVYADHGQHDMPCSGVDTRVMNKEDSDTYMVEASYSGGMIIGADADELSVPEDYVSDFTEDGDEIELYEWAEEVGLEYFSSWYDAGDEGRVYGFIIKSRWRESEIEGLMKEVKQKMAEFKKLTGVEPMFIGMQDIY